MRLPRDPVLKSASTPLAERVRQRGSALLYGLLLPAGMPTDPVCMPAVHALSPFVDRLRTATPCKENRTT